MTPFGVAGLCHDSWIDVELVATAVKFLGASDGTGRETKTLMP